MSQEEHYGFRDEVYSRWHRCNSTARYFDNDIEEAKKLSQIDLDWVEYCNECFEPIMLVETARDVGQPYKCASVTKHLAEMAGIRAILVLYLSNQSNTDIVKFRVKPLAPVEKDEFEMTPAQYATALRRLREEHACGRFANRRKVNAAQSKTKGVLIPMSVVGKVSEVVMKPPVLIQRNTETVKKVIEFKEQLTLSFVA